MQKQIDLEKTKKVLTWTKKAGIVAKGNFILGYLEETKETLQETLNFILNSDLDYFQQTFLSPYPGSRVYEIAANYGEVNLDWASMDNMEINFVPTGLTRADLLQFSKKAFFLFYLRPKIILFHLMQINSLEAARRIMIAFISFLKTILR